jgi:hypothetical protein
MVARYFELVNFVKDIAKTHKDVLALTLSTAEEVSLADLNAVLVKFQSVTLALQSIFIFPLVQRLSLQGPMLRCGR